LHLLGDVASLSLSVILSRVLLFARDLVLAGIMGPITYGLWTQMVVIFNYALQLPLGFQNAMSREVPYFIGRKEIPRVLSIHDIVFSVTLSTAILAGVLVLSAYGVFNYHLLDLPVIAVAIIMGVIVIQQINAFYSILLRAHQKFHAFSIGFVLVALLSLILSAMMAPVWGAVGAAVALGVSYITVTIFWLFHASYLPIKIKFNLMEFKRLVKIAIPLFIIGISGLLIVSIDRLTMVMFYDKEQIGYYGLAFIVNQSIFLITTPIMQSLSPRLMQAYGRYNDPLKIKHYLFVFTTIMGGGIALLVGIIYLFIGNLIILILPKFVPAVEVIRILLLGGAFSALASGATSFLVAINKQWQVLRIQMVVITVQMIVIGFIVLQSGTISQIAAAMVVAYFAYALLSVTLAGFSLRHSIKDAIKYWLSSSLSVLYLLSCAVLISQWKVVPGENKTGMIMALQIALLMGTALPVLIYIYKKVYTLILRH